MADDEAGSEEAIPSPSSTNTLSCISCRTRKLKCDRIQPTCTRCAKYNGGREYPEPQRKINFRRRNIKRLEARVAQVESYLQDATRTEQHTRPPSAKQLSGRETQSPEKSVQGSNLEALSFQPEAPTLAHAVTKQAYEPVRGHDHPRLHGADASESLPSSEVMEELNKLYFENYYAQMPIVHPGRFWEAFAGGPQKRPPACLMYAMWALASQSHPKYEHRSSEFYQCARRYIDADELKTGSGRGFITIPHAQTFAIMATYEAKCMLFTSGTMSCTKCIRLINMMSLDRVDEIEADNLAMPWIEAEEKRRTFWGAFVIDAFASLSTGLPSLINKEKIRTRLPASEEAFLSGIEGKSPFLEEAFEGASYGEFSSTIIICQVCQMIMHHSRRTNPRHDPKDLLNDMFWVEHHELDHKLSTLFMFLPECLRLPQNVQNPAAIHANLSFHACIISLHHRAIEEAEKYGPESNRLPSLARLRASADEIVGIIKLTAHRASVFTSPLSPVSLYCALSVYVYIAKEDGRSQFSGADKVNLLTVIRCMEAIGRAQPVTKAFLHRACQGIARNNLSTRLEMPTLKRYEKLANEGVSTISINGPTTIGRQARHLPVLQRASGLDISEGQVANDSAIAVGGDEKAGEDCFEGILGAATRNVAASPGRHEYAQASEGNLASNVSSSASTIDTTRTRNASGTSRTSRGFPNMMSSADTLQHQCGEMNATDTSMNLSAFNSADSGFGTRSSNSDSTSAAPFGVGMVRFNFQEPQLGREPPSWPIPGEGAFGNLINTMMMDNVVATNDADRWNMPDSITTWTDTVPDSGT